jgi:hypothetical protein
LAERSRLAAGFADIVNLRRMERLKNVKVMRWGR